MFSTFLGLLCFRRDQTFQRARLAGNNPFALVSQWQKPIKTCKSLIIVPQYIFSGTVMTNLSLLRAFGLVVRTRRRALDMTQQALAFVSSVDRSFIARIETGKHQPSLTVIFGLARGLSMSPQTLIAATEEATTSNVSKIGDLGSD